MFFVSVQDLSGLIGFFDPGKRSRKLHQLFLEAAELLTDVAVHHLGTVFAHGLQVVDLTLQERYLGFQVLVLFPRTHKHTDMSEVDD